MAAVDSTRQAIWAERRRQRRKLQQEIDRVKREEVRAEKRLRTEKRCPKCENVKPISEFHACKSRADGLRPWCKGCKRGDDKEWRSRNPEKQKELGRSWASKNPDRVASKAKKYKERHPGAMNAHQANWVSRNQDKIRRARETIHGRLRSRISCGIRRSLVNGKGGKPSFSLLDYTRDELRLHIERQFHDGMDWPAFIRGEIHIDHIVPLSSFKIISADCAEFKRAWALSNLRPLWAGDNFSKNARRLFLI